MVTSRKLNLTRDQLATFLKDQVQIRQFELLFSTGSIKLASNQPIVSGSNTVSPEVAKSQSHSCAAILKPKSLSCLILHLKML